MTPLGNLTSAWRRVPALALALTIALAGASPASAGDASAEHEQLAALARQLDLKRVRAGLQDYLVPQRAQPRDPVPLAGDYVRRDRADDEEPSP